MLKGESLCESAFELKLIDIEYDEWGNFKLIQTTPLKAFAENIHQELEWEYGEDNAPEWREILSRSLQNQREKCSSNIHERHFNLILARQNYLIIRRLREIVMEKTSKIQRVIDTICKQDPVRQHWNLFVFPMDELEMRKVTSIIREAIFRADEVAKYESRYGQTILKQRQPERHIEQKDRSRNNTRRQIYMAAASRAVTVIQELIHNDILPNTKAQKLACLRNDKNFQKIIAALPKDLKDTTLIRRLNEAHPGIWALGKKSTRESNKKYRKKSLY
jgi:hypothetical protein